MTVAIFSYEVNGHEGQARPNEPLIVTILPDQIRVR